MASASLEHMRRLIDEPHASTHLRVFKESATIAQMPAALSKHGLSGKGSGQFVQMHFQTLAQLHPELLDRAESDLGHLGVKPEHIRQYLTLGREAGIIFALMHERTYPHAEVIVPFRDAADQYALERLREWLGIARRA